MTSESESEVAQSYLTLYDPMDCSLPGSSIMGFFQARILEWVAISFTRGSSQPRDRTWVSCIVSRDFTVWATREVLGLPLTQTECKIPLEYVINTDSFIPFSAWICVVCVKFKPQFCIFAKCLPFSAWINCA